MWRSPNELKTQVLNQLQLQYKRNKERIEIQWNLPGIAQISVHQN